MSDNFELFDCADLGGCTFEELLVLPSDLQLPIEDPFGDWPDIPGEAENCIQDPRSDEACINRPEYLVRGEIETLDDRRVDPYSQPSLFEPGRKVVHEIYRLPSDGGDSLHRRLERLGTAHGRSVNGIWAARHDNHLHVQHGCPSNQRCQCRCIRSAFGKPKPHSAITVDSVLYGDENRVGMWKHLDQGPGLRKWVFLQNSVGESFDYCGDCSIPADQRPNDRTEEGTRYEKQSPCFSVQATGTTPLSSCPDEPSEDATDEPVQKRPRIAVFSTAEAAIQLAAMEWTTNISTILSHPLLHREGHTYNIIARRADLEKQLTAMLEVEFEKMKTMSIADIRDVIGANPSFGLTKMQTRDKSFYALKKWFLGQANNCPLAASQLVLYFEQWFNGELGKKNTILLIGPPSCAKTWVSQAFQRLGRWSGNILPWNKNNSSFIWQETVTARIISHDECRQPIVDVGYLETLKQVYAGTQVNVDKKFKSAMLTSGAPVIATCNFDPIQNNCERPAFDERWTRINCQKVDELKDVCSLACNPLAIFDLIDWAVEHCNDDPEINIAF